MEITRYINGRVIVKVGDITDEQTDALVNAANWTLLGGGGVDGAIHDRGGSEIYAACQQIREDRYSDGLPTGEAVVTTGGDLHPKYVIHTVGPIYGQNNGRDAQLLFDSYTNALLRANELGLRSVAFPSISTGAFYFPKQSSSKGRVDSFAEIPCRS